MTIPKGSAHHALAKPARLTVWPITVALVLRSNRGPSPDPPAQSTSGPGGRHGLYPWQFVGGAGGGGGGLGAGHSDFARRQAPAGAPCPSPASFARTSPRGRWPLVEPAWCS